MLAALKARSCDALLRAAVSVNRELILLYWEIGRRDILLRQSVEGWGTTVIDRLARDLRRDFLEMTGLSPCKTCAKRTEPVAMYPLFIDAAPDGAVTFADVFRKTVSARFAGTPEQIADEVERWDAAGVAGFNVVPVTTLGWWGEFVDHVVPALQKRGLMQTQYADGTLR